MSTRNEIEVVLRVDDTDPPAVRVAVGTALKLDFISGPAATTTTTALPILQCSYPSHVLAPLLWDADQPYGKLVAVIPSVDVPGSYQYRILVAGQEVLSGYFVVEPTVRIRGQPIPIPALVIETVLTKCLGVSENWMERLKVSVETGFNAIHFTPVHALGESRSAYSLRSNSDLEPSQFPQCKDAGSRWAALTEIIRQLEHEHGVLSLQDCVWNHVSPDTDWLREHPEATYNMRDCPWLHSAVDVDNALLAFSRRIANGDFPNVCARIETEHYLQLVLGLIRSQILPELKLYEYFVIHIDNAVESFRHGFNNGLPENADELAKQPLVINPQYARNGASLDLCVALAKYRNLSVDEAVHRLRVDLHDYNESRFSEYRHDLGVIADNIGHRFRYQRWDQNGPRLGDLTDESPLAESYFTRLSDAPEHVMVNNGWVWNGDPRIDQASRSAKAYLLREVISWRDCVKLRYGSSFEDNPWLWTLMREYTEKIASIFHGIRAENTQFKFIQPLLPHLVADIVCCSIDNAHSTPIHVAEHMLRAGRAVNPNLIVVAELFTGSEELDRYYCDRLALTALIREGMNAHSPQDLGRIAFLHGGNDGIGRLASHIHRRVVDTADPTYKLGVAAGHHLPALFMDATHDNPFPAEKRCVADSLPSSAIVAASRCCAGSTRGYGEFFLKNLDVVLEDRVYQTNANVGMNRARTLLNQLHVQLELEGFIQQFVDQRNKDVLCVVRSNPCTLASYIFIIRSAFGGEHLTHHSEMSHLAPVELELSAVEEVVLEARVLSDNVIAALQRLHDHPPMKDGRIHGLAGELLKMHEHAPPSDAEFVKIWQTSSSAYVDITSLQPGDVCVLRARPYDEVSEVLTALNTSNWLAECQKVVDDLDAQDLQQILYSCEVEEQNAGGHAYVIDHYGPLTYLGLAGVEYALNDARRAPTTGHPLLEHLRRGNWLVEFCTNRLLRDYCSSRVQNYGRALRAHLELVVTLPRAYVPTHFDEIVVEACHQLHQRALHLMSLFVRNGGSFIHSLALTSVQLYGRLESGRMFDTNDASLDDGGSLAAGLPHFAVGYMRAWGRDTFLSFSGLFLVTGRHAEARTLLLRFASVVRHGLVPNLLANGRRPRYNARDATWFFLVALQKYCLASDEGLAFLSEKVQRRFPTDDLHEHESKYGNGVCEDQFWTMQDVVQHILQRHAEGISFREWNAGDAIDNHMTWDGFQVDAGLELATGFIYGGNSKNCGTWMDKMGESVSSHTMGVPASPRDGSAIEIVACCKATVRWLSELARQKKWPHTGVTLASGEMLTFVQWDERLQSSFEPYFFVPECPADDGAFHCQSNIVHRRNMYRDTRGSSLSWTDYQLRPNQCVAMSIAPELFQASHAIAALNLISETLVGPAGMKTLDPKDWNYRPDYDNEAHGPDRLVNRGFNYHQGPEWLWLSGHYLMALHIFKHPEAETRLATTIQHMTPLIEQEWLGLPELTNADGVPCRFSCPTQAWSSACMLEAIDLFCK